MEMKPVPPGSDSSKIEKGILHLEERPKPSFLEESVRP